MAETHAQIIVREGDRRLLQRAVGTGQLVIGCDKSCDIRIDLLGVSHRHAQLTVSEGALAIEDLGSTNGTFVDGVPVKGCVPVKPGQLIEIATAVLEIRKPGTASGTATDRTRAMAAKMEEGLDEPLPASPVADSLRPLNYVVGGEVARGGMGSVLYAKDLNIRRSVAMKVILPDKHRTTRDLLRFVEEAQVTGQLEHPNIMPIHELGQDDQARLFYTMKYVKGVTLKNVIEDIAAGKREVIGKYSLTHLLTIYEKVCDAVAFAHSKGVVHRDLKPDNIMLGDYGEVLVMDWGLAKILTPTGKNPEEGRWVVQSARVLEGEPYQTLDGAVMGTPQFMSPEQAEGSIDQIDPRTDVFTLGGILYSILTLHPPYTGDTLEEAMRRVRAQEILPPATYNAANLGRRRKAEAAGAYPAEMLHYSYQPIPDSLAAVAMKALAIQKVDRYQSVKELQQDLDAYKSGFATRAERAGAFKQVFLALKRHKAEAAVLTVSIAVLATFGVGSVRRIMESERRAVTTLDKLHATAPEYYDKAVAFIQQQKFADALQKISSAITLQPDEPEYYYMRGNILQSLFRFEPARESYAHALQLAKYHERAAINLEMCEKLLRDNKRWTELLPSSLYELQATMRKQDRVAEAAAVSQLLQPDKKIFVNTWKEILEKLGAAEKLSTLKVDDEGKFSIDLSNTKVGDLSALAGIPITWLNLSHTEVADLSPLKGMPLVHLDLDDTPVRNLAPLQGLPLKQLSLWHVKISDLTPLKGMPLTRLMLDSTDVTDLSPLTGLPLHWLSVQSTQLSDITSLAGMPLNYLALAGTNVSDLTPLKSMVLTELHLEGTPVSDLSPLQGLSLAILGLSYTGVENIEPLKDMPLTTLFLRDTKVCDLAALQGMPLKTLNLKGCTALQDLSPLIECAQLERLVIPKQCKDIEMLRTLLNLKQLAYDDNTVGDWAEFQTVSDFWRDYDTHRRATR